MPMRLHEHTMKYFGPYGTRLWIPLIVILSLTQTACTTLDKVVCTGTGTCGAGNSYPTATKTYVSPIPQTVITPVGNLIIVRDQSSGAISSVISVSGGK